MFLLLPRKRKYPGVFLQTEEQSCLSSADHGSQTVVKCKAAQKVERDKSFSAAVCIGWKNKRELLSE